MKDTCDFSAFTAYCLENNILHIEFKKVKKLAAKDVEEVFSCYDKIGKGKKVYSLVTFKSFIPMSDEAMQEAKKQNKKNLSGAAVYVVHNFALRMSIKFFMNFYKPKHPINITPTKSEAISWLKQQMKAGQN